MNRCNFYNTVTNSGVKELDFLDTDLSNFTTSYPVSLYQVTQNDLMNPDLISYKAYGTSDFWWIIMLINQLDNPFTDLEIGMVLALPDKLDLYNWQRKYQKRATN